MEDPFSRARMLLGDEAMERLGQAGVAVFGLGGVGGAAAEALGRAGIGRLALFDPDRVAPTNLNRQTAALHSTIGRLKAEVMRDRLLDIHPGADVTAYPLFYAADNADGVDLSMFSYIVDAIDTVTSKLLLAERAMAVGVPLISCIGTGNKLDPSRLRVADIADTRVCPLARVMRRELKKRGIFHLKVVYSEEPPQVPLFEEPADASRRQTPGSVSFVPPAAGLLLASAVVRDLIGGA